MKIMKDVSHFFRLMTLARIPLVFLAIFVSTARGAPAIEKARLLEKVFDLPAQIEKDVYKLEALMVRPPGSGPFPLALIGHGSPRGGAPERKLEHVMKLSDIGYEFAQRGYVSLVFMRRGYGCSEGEWAEGYGENGLPDYWKAGKATAEDFLAAIRWASQFSYIDKHQIVVIGHSAGGFGGVALAANAPEGLRAVISFGGGRGSTKDHGVRGGNALANTFEEFGRTARVPMLWIYCENDTFFPPDQAKQYHERFIHAGGVAQLEIVPSYGAEGHGLVLKRGGISIWRPLVDSFLRNSKLPTWDSPPQSPVIPKLPAPAGLSKRGLDQWQQYLEGPAHKAWALDKATGAWGYRTGMNTLDEAVNEASKNAGSKGQIISVDDKMQSSK